MPIRSDLEAAVAEGIIDAQQAERLGVFLANRAGDDPWSTPAGEAAEAEDVRFVRGFHDIFIAVGIAILFIGLAAAGGVTGNATATLAVSALIAWGLAEFLARRRRLVLPSIVLCLAFVACAGAVAWGLFDSQFESVFKAGKASGAIAISLTGLAAASIFFFRFRLPFAVGVMAASAIALVFSMLGSVDPDIVKNNAIAIFLISGLCTFAAAMAFDLSDPERKTLRADNAFWLHLLSAPLLVHSILTFVAFGEEGENDLAGAGAVIAVIFALALVALLVDRRAMLVVALSYLGAAIATVLGEISVEATTIAAITLIILGTGVVALGSGWQATRAVLFKILPLPPSLAGRLPPVRGKASERSMKTSMDSAYE